MTLMRPRPLFLFELLDNRTFLDAVVIEGIQSAALDQPRINAMLSRTPNGAPLQDVFDFGFFNLNAAGVGTALLDTGASGLLLSDFWADFLDVDRAVHNSQEVIFGDVGVGGVSDFNVSEPLYMRLANYTPTVDGDDIDEYDTTYMPPINAGATIRTQIGPLGGSSLLEGINVIGMPAMTGKVTVFDPKPVDTFADTMRTYLYNPGTPYNPATADSNPGIPATDYQVKLSYVSFDRFTTLSPPGAPGPNLRTNPFIGPNPFLPGDTTPPVTVRHGSMTTTGSYLLDTGAAASIISRQQAMGLGVSYVPGTYGTSNPQLQGTGNARTFKLTIGGTGGETTLAGFFMDSLALPTVQGDPIEYRTAPVLIGDISLQDPSNSEIYTLDGIFGMNFLVATANINTDEPFPFPTDLTVGAMDWITFDEPNKLLGLQVREEIPGPEVIDELFEHDFAPQSYYFQFSRNVGASLSLDDLVVTNLTTGQTIPSSQLALQWEPAVNTATLNFPGYAPSGILPDGNYRVHIDSEEIEDQFGLPMIADYDGYFFSLNGDADRDRKVDIGDFSVVATNFNQEEQTWADGDFNLDEIVTIADFSILASNFNKELPPPATGQRAPSLPGAAPRALRSGDPMPFTKVFFAPFAGDKVIA
jgi:hypothetical protein